MEEGFFVGKITDMGTLGGNSFEGGPVWVSLDTGERFEMNLAPGAHTWGILTRGEEVNIWVNASGRVTTFASRGPLGRAYIVVPLV